METKFRIGATTATRKTDDGNEKFAVKIALLGIEKRRRVVFETISRPLRVCVSYTHNVAHHQVRVRSRRGRHVSRVENVRIPVFRARTETRHYSLGKQFFVSFRRRKFSVPSVASAFATRFALHFHGRVPRRAKHTFLPVSRRPAGAQRSFRAKGRTWTDVRNYLAKVFFKYEFAFKFHRRVFHKRCTDTASYFARNTRARSILIALCGH